MRIDLKNCTPRDDNPHSTFMAYIKGGRHFKCMYCDVAYTHKNNLVKHLRRVHPKQNTSWIESTIRPFRCTICCKGFFSEYDLKRHMMIHFDARPFKCKFCDRACKWKSNLIKHQRKMHRKHCISKLSTSVKEAGSAILADVLRQDKFQPFVKLERLVNWRRTRNNRWRVLEKKTLVALYVISKTNKIRKSTIKTTLFIHKSDRPFKCEICNTLFQKRVWSTMNVAWMLQILNKDRSTASSATVSSS